MARHTISAFRPTAGPATKVVQMSLRQALRSTAATCSRRTHSPSSTCFKALFERRVSVKQLSGPIGIGIAVHEAAPQLPTWMPLIDNHGQDFDSIWRMMNLLPFPILDGGMIFLLIIESLFRRDLPMPGQRAHLPGRLRLHSPVRGHGHLQRHHQAALYGPPALLSPIRLC